MLRLLLLVSVLGCFARISLADEVMFKNGDRVSGSVTISEGRITIHHSVFGTVSADANDVKSVSTTQPTLATTAPTSAPTSNPTTIATTTTAPVPGAAVPPAPAPKRWSGSVTAGAIIQRGNSDTESFNVAANATRQGDNNTLSLSAAYAFGQSRDKDTGVENTTTDTWFTQAKLDHSLSAKWYDYALIRVEQDNVANLHVRVTPGVGMGYRWINKPETHFNTEAGVTWVYEQYDTAGSREHIAARLAYHYDRKINDKVSIVHNLEYLPNVADISDFNLNIDISVRAALIKATFFEVKALWQHDSQPAPGAEDDDLLFTLGLGWNF